MSKLRFGENSVPVIEVDSRKIVRLMDKIEIEVLPQDVIEAGTIKVDIRPTAMGEVHVFVSGRKLTSPEFFGLMKIIK